MSYVSASFKISPGDLNYTTILLLIYEYLRRTVYVPDVMMEFSGTVLAHTYLKGWKSMLLSM